jgi:serine/threonine protein kinase
MGVDVHLRGGRYIVQGILGEGTQGTTYDALDAANGNRVAIKRFDVRGARGWKDVELAEREARVLATLDHPLVPRYLEHFEENGSLYLVMEKVEGETLETVRRRGPLPEAEVRRFLACADRALTYLHGRSSPVVHRDIKPRNVVRRPDGSYVFVDFGAVSELMLRRPGGSTVVGTIGFMAPEQLQGRALPATDVYAVGATALAALTGIEPEDLPHRGLAIDVRAALAGRASPELTSSLERMLEPDPDRRAASLGAALDGVASTPLAGGLTTSGIWERRLHDEDAVVKSVRGLLWTLWGISWVILPVILGKIRREPELIPVIMFTSLAALIVLGWHKGALLRLVIRTFTSAFGERSGATMRGTITRRRVEVGGDRRVRVHSDGSALRPDELFGQTEVESAESARSRRAARQA